MWILAKFGEKFDGMIQEALLIYSESFIMIAVDSQNKQTNKQTHVWTRRVNSYTLFLKKTSQLWQAIVSSSMDWFWQHQHTYKNYVHIQLSLSSHICLLYLLLNNCDGNDAKHNEFSSVDCWWLWREPVPLKRTDILADVQSGVLSPSHMHITAFSIDQQLRWGHFVICFPCVNEALLQVAGVASRVHNVPPQLSYVSTLPDITLKLKRDIDELKHWHLRRLLYNVR